MANRLINVSPPEKYVCGKCCLWPWTLNPWPWKCY